MEYFNTQALTELLGCSRTKLREIFHVTGIQPDFETPSGKGTQLFFKASRKSELIEALAQYQRITREASRQRSMEKQMAPAEQAKAAPAAQPSAERSVEALRNDMLHDHEVLGRGLDQLEAKLDRVLAILEHNGFALPKE